MPAVIFQDTERASSCNILRPNYIILVSTFSSLASESHHTTRSISSSILPLLYVPSIKSEKRTWLGYHLLLRCSYEMFLPPHRSIFYIIDTCIINAHFLYNASSDKTRAPGVSPRGHWTTTRQLQFAIEHRTPLRLKERAFPEPIPDNSYPDCQQQISWSHIIPLQAMYKTPLCLYPCVEIFHIININHSHAVDYHQ